MKVIFKNRFLLLAILAFLVSLFAYSQFFGVRFMDFDVVPKITYHAGTGPGAILKIFTEKEGFVLFQMGYRPFTSLVWWSFLMLFGLDFMPFHFLNFLLHAINSVLVFLLARKLLKDNSGIFSFIAALVFALHPVQLEVVVLVSRFAELLVAFFLLSALLSFDMFLRGGKKKFYIASLFLSFLGMLSKEAGCLIPFMLFFYAMIFQKGKPGLSQTLKLLRTFIPFFASIAIFAGMLFLVLGQFGGYVVPIEKMPPGSITASFFQKLFYPIHFFGPDSSLFPMAFPEGADLLFSLLFAAFCILFLFFLSRKSKELFFLFLFIFSFLTAYIAFGFFQGWYLYAPSAAFSIIVAFLLKACFEKTVKRREYSVFLFLISLLSASFIALSPLLVPYPQPLYAGKIAQAAFDATLPAVGGLPQNSVLYLVNYPEYYWRQENNYVFAAPVISHVAMHGFLKYHFPESSFRLMSLTYTTPIGPDINPDDYRFYKAGEMELVLEKSGGSENLYIAYNGGESEAEIEGIKMKKTAEGGTERISFSLPDWGFENHYILFFNGQEVKVVPIYASAG